MWKFSDSDVSLGSLYEAHAVIGRALRPLRDALQTTAALRGITPAHALISQQQGQRINDLLSRISKRVPDIWFDKILTTTYLYANVLGFALPSVLETVRRQLLFDWLLYWDMTEDVKPFYKDHFVHQLRVTLTALTVLGSKFSGSGWPDSEESKYWIGIGCVNDQAEFHRAQTAAVALAGLFHDTGYPIYAMVHFGEQASLETALAGTTFDDVILNGDDFSTGLIALALQHLRFVEKSDHAGAWVRTVCRGRKDSKWHAYISGLAILALRRRIMEQLGPLAPRAEFILQLAALAAFLHHAWEDSELEILHERLRRELKRQDPPRTLDPPDLQPEIRKQYPTCWRLQLADVPQEWGRPFLAVGKGCTQRLFPLKGFELDESTGKVCGEPDYTSHKDRALRFGWKAKDFKKGVTNHLNEVGLP